MRTMLLVAMLVLGALSAGWADPLPIAQRWGGFAHLPMSRSGQSKAPYADLRVIRSQADLDAFVSTIPTHQISQTRPSPPSNDPLLKKPTLDFARYTAIVVYTDFIYATPKIDEVSKRGDGVQVKVTRTQPPDARQYAYPLGVGRYEMVLVPRFSGSVVEAGTNETP